VTSGAVSYQLQIRLAAPARLVIGKLGTFNFPAGYYVYTGSARRNMETRIARHLQREKRLRWHIDYLLACPESSVITVERSDQPECVWNQQGEGQVLIPKFGASDCRQGCGSHLKYVGK
jgi:Uri superfamily endonuclease